MLYVQYVELMYYKLKPFTSNCHPLSPYADSIVFVTLSAFLVFFCTLLMNHYESLILSQLTLLVSSMKSQNSFGHLHSASNLKVKDEMLENASGDLQSTIKWLNIFLVIFLNEAQLLPC